MLMNNKGFTLIELLGVVLLLAILLVVSVPTIQSIITGSKTKSLELIKDNVKTALESYVSEYGCTRDGNSVEWTTFSMCQCTLYPVHTCDTCGVTHAECNSITMNDLIAKGALQANSINEQGESIKKIINPVTNEEADFTLKVKRVPIPDEAGVYKYTYDVTGE